MKGNRLRARRMSEALRWARETYSMPQQHLEFLLVLYDAGEPVSQLDIAAMSGLTQAAVSRAAATLGERWAKDEKGEPYLTGAKFVKVEVDPFDTRRKLVALTERGKEAVEGFLDRA